MASKIKEAGLEISDYKYVQVRKGKYLLETYDTNGKSPYCLTNLIPGKECCLITERLDDKIFLVKEVKEWVGIPGKLHPSTAKGVRRAFAKHGDGWARPNWVAKIHP